MCVLLRGEPAPSSACRAGCAGCLLGAGLAGASQGSGKGAAPSARPELRVAEGRRRCTGLQLERRCNVWSSAPPPARCGNRIYAPP